MYLLSGAASLNDVFVRVLIVEGGETVVKEDVIVRRRAEGILLLHLDSPAHYEIACGNN